MEHKSGIIYLFSTFLGFILGVSFHDVLSDMAYLATVGAAFMTCRHYYLTDKKTKK